MAVGEYHISSDGESYGYDCFKTREDAIRAGLSQYNKSVNLNELTDLFSSKEQTENHPHFYIGKEMAFTPSVDEEWIVEPLVELAYDFAGEYSEGYLERRYTSEEDWVKLRNMLQETFDKWATETNNEPNFFMVEESEYIEIENIPEILKTTED